MIPQFRHGRTARFRPRPQATLPAAAVALVLLGHGTLAPAAESPRHAATPPVLAEVDTAVRRGASPADRIPNPLANTPLISPSVTGADAEKILAGSLPRRSDSPFDWRAPLECLHGPGEPRLLPPCVPLPPCHPSLPPRPYDLVGVRGAPTAGPIYGGPCHPRTGTHDDCRFPHLHRLCDRWFDWFYRTK